MPTPPLPLPLPPLPLPTPPSVAVAPPCRCRLPPPLPPTPCRCPSLPCRCLLLPPLPPTPTPLLHPHSPRYRPQEEGTALLRPRSPRFRVPLLKFTPISTPGGVYCPPPPSFYYPDMTGLSHSLDTTLHVYSLVLPDSSCYDGFIPLTRRDYAFALTSTVPPTAPIPQRSALVPLYLCRPSSLITLSALSHSNMSLCSLFSVG